VANEFSGNDVCFNSGVGGGCEGSSGDDMSIASEGIEKYRGNFGFDCISYHRSQGNGEGRGVLTDLTAEILLAPVAFSAEVHAYTHRHRHTYTTHSTYIYTHIHIHTLTHIYARTHTHTCT
jgi:hypothetical protein